MTASTRVSIGLLLVCFALPPAPRAQDVAPGTAEAAALAMFQARVADYAALHRQLEAPLPSLKSAHSARAVLLNQTYLAAAIRRARPHAKQGDILSPAVAVFFRTTLRQALEDSEGPAEQARSEPSDRGHFHPRVYDAFPDWATHDVPAMLRPLPPLPEDIEYRLVDHDLVLLDVHANLIVDVLPDAVPHLGS